MEKNTERKHWMRTLALSLPEQLQRLWQMLAIEPEHEVIRPVEVGLVPVLGRMGATGKPFIAGDMTITRVTVRLAGGTCGFAYVYGRKPGHAHCCALVDAMLQEEAYHDQVMEKVINPLRKYQQQIVEKRRTEIAASRVDFFTLVSGDN